MVADIPVPSKWNTLPISEHALNTIVAKLQQMHAVPRISPFKHSKEGVVSVDRFTRTRTRTYLWRDSCGTEVTANIKIQQKTQRSPLPETEGDEPVEQAPWIAQGIIISGLKGSAVLPLGSEESVRAFLALGSGPAFAFDENKPAFPSHRDRE